MKPHFRSFPLFPAAAIAAAAILSAAPAAHAQKQAPNISLSPESPTIGVPVSIEAQAKSLGVSVAVMGQIQAVIADKATWTPAQQKMDSHLLYAARQAQSGMQIPGRPDIQLDEGVTPDASGRVDVVLRATVTPALLNAITQSGGEIKSVVEEYKTIHALVALGQLETLAARSEVNVIEKWFPPRHFTGSVTSEGDTTHQAATARSTFSLTGQGQKIGVMSGDAKFFTQSKASGDLVNAVIAVDANNKPLDGLKNSSTDGEGTAMMEIVQDIAPKASIVFSSDSDTDAGAAVNLRRLYDIYGANIILDDFRYFTEMPFQDDIIAQAVNYVTSKGVLYFSSAGNGGSAKYNTSGTWEGDFVAGPVVTDPSGKVSGLVHQYNSTTTGMYNTSTIDGGGAAFIYWADPANAFVNDYDTYSTSSDGKTLRSIGTTFQGTGAKPYEYVITSFVDDRIYVVAKNGVKPRALHIDSLGDAFGPGLTFNTQGETYGHSAAAQAFSVAAAPATFEGNTGAVGPFYSSPNYFVSSSPLEQFSSDGPRQLFYNPDGSAITPANFLFGTNGGTSRQKPDITAADGVTVSSSILNFSPFYGTSAAAPHAGAIAGLIKSMNGMTGSAFIKGSLLSYDEMYTTLTGSAVDLTGSGLDINSGYGVVMPLNALNFLKNLATNVVVSNIRNNSATVSWKTNLPARSTFTYAAGASAGGTVFTDPTYTTTHSVTLGGLVAGTKYAFAIGATTQTGSVVFQDATDRTFTTGGISPTTTLAFATTASAVRSGPDLIVTVNIVNSGTGIANGISLISATLSGATVKTVFPVTVGSGLYPGATLPAPVRFTYPTGKSAGASVTLSVNGKLTNGPDFSGTATVKLP